MDERHVSDRADGHPRQRPRQLDDGREVPLRRQPQAAAGQIRRPHHMDSAVSGAAQCARLRVHRRERDDLWAPDVLLADRCRRRRSTRRRRGAVPRGAPRQDRAGRGQDVALIAGGDCKAASRQLGQPFRSRPRGQALCSL
eukprot:Amastigsp_a851383_15.p3 type:complete len:141 gc:universal Amastigsp_a851383_15:1445-1023(-)